MSILEYMMVPNTFVYLALIGVVLGIIAIGLFIWLRKQQQISDGLHAAELDHTHHGMNAMMDDFNNYQVKTDRKITELEKQLEIKTKQLERSQAKLKKDLPTDIRKVIGHIEFARPLDNK
tara:strand:- start:90 stop:449 length:360 start_codon:yes stop_codon:yes gene_type:complete